MGPEYAGLRVRVPERPEFSGVKFGGRTVRSEKTTEGNGLKHLKSTQTKRNLAARFGGWSGNQESEKYSFGGVCWNIYVQSKHCPVAS